MFAEFKGVESKDLKKVIEDKLKEVGLSHVFISAYISLIVTNEYRQGWGRKSWRVQWGNEEKTQCCHKFNWAAAFDFHE